MKRYMSLMLVLAILLSFTACGKKKDTIQNPVNFYFVNKNVEYGVENGLICAEVQEGMHLQDDVFALVVQYLKGPKSPQLLRAIPAGVSVSEVDISTDTVVVTLSHAFGRTNGIDLSVASACLAMTIFDFTDVNLVRIRAKNSLVGDNEFVSISRENLLLSDTLINKDN